VQRMTSFAEVEHGARPDSPGEGLVASQVICK